MNRERTSSWLSLVVATTLVGLAGCTESSSHRLTEAQMRMLTGDPMTAVRFFSDMSTAETIRINVSGELGGAMTDVTIALNIGKVLDQTWTDGGNSAGNAIVAAVCPELGTQMDQSRAQVGTQLIAAITSRKQANHTWTPVYGVAAGVSRILACNIASLVGASPRVGLGLPVTVTWPEIPVSSQGTLGPDGSWLLGVNGIEFGTTLQLTTAAGQSVDSILAAWDEYLPVFFTGRIGTDQQSITALYVDAQSAASHAAMQAGCVLAFIINNPMAGTRENPSLSSLGIQIGKAGMAATSAVYASFVQALVDAGYFTPDVIAQINNNYSFHLTQPPPGLQPGDQLDLNNTQVTAWLNDSLLAHPYQLIKSARPGDPTDTRFVVTIP